MPLPIGTRIGPYEITGLLGAGGMGEVYRARDARLARDVALKVLPDAFAADPERLARFEREAQVLAALKHPNIGAIYGLEGNALVLELIEGETLADRIARGSIPVDEALPIAKQIAEALETAHEQGIIHRDLKPANIKVTPDGVVKVLDFGLAKLTEASEAGKAGGAGEGPLAQLSMSPTLTSPAATGLGVILGTAAYMAPEQAKGRPADKRSDVWAFGCVLFEMLAGKRAFDADDVSDTLALVLKGQPDWHALPEDLPPSIRTLIRACLEKDRRQRASDISNALFVLSHQAELSPAGDTHLATAAAASQPRSWRRYVADVLLLSIAALLTGIAVWFFMRPAPSRVTRMTITPPADQAITLDGNDRDLAITPDGANVIYAGGARLFVRPLDSLEPRLLATLGAGAQAIFTSPDGQWVGYVENNTLLKKVAITGGPPVTLLTMDANSRGVTWTANDTLVFATSQQGTGLQSVSAAGGEATVLTRPDAAHGESDHLWPEALPGGRKVLFTITASSGGLDAAQVAVLDLDSGRRTIILRGGSHAHYVASGQLLYAAAGTLRAVAFDPDRLVARGTSVPVLPRLVTTGPGAADFGVAANGTLVYVDAPGVNGLERTLSWVDRKGGETPISLPLRPYLFPRLSPDGSRIAVSINDQEQDIWIWSLMRSTLTRLTFEPANDSLPLWTPDGKNVVFASSRDLPGGLYLQAADGTGRVERLTKPTGTGQFPTSISPDGSKVLLYQAVSPNGPTDLRVITLSQPRGKPVEVETLFETRFFERNGVISPDGRWVAYEANPSGQPETYVRPFPNVGNGQWQVSAGGGRQPLWSRDGRELFYLAPDGALMSVAVEARGASWNAGSPMKLFDAGSLYALGGGYAQRMYDVSADGQRFLIIKQGTDQKSTPPQIIVVENWFEELKKLVSPN